MAGVVTMGEILSGHNVAIKNIETYGAVLKYS